MILIDEIKKLAQHGAHWSQESNGALAKASFGGTAMGVIVAGYVLASAIAKAGAVVAQAIMEHGHGR